MSSNEKIYESNNWVFHDLIISIFITIFMDMNFPIQNLMIDSIFSLGEKLTTLCKRLH